MCLLPARRRHSRTLDLNRRNALEGWTLVTYGPSAGVALDGDVVREGRQSLRVSVQVASDVALGQDLALEPARFYRFTGWVKTQGLERLDGKVSGTFQVQRAADRSAIASGENHHGNTDWSRVELAFVAPADGRIRIAPFLVGYGKRAGHGVV